ncbi:MAG: hypothetical protein V4613_10080 [Bacteroidota bacterium]
MKKIILLVVLTAVYAHISKGQIDSSLLKRIPKDTAKQLMNMDAIYNRPFLGIGKLPVSLGGYAEVNWQHIGTDGISDGHQFQMRRMTLFVASSVSKRIKFLSEIEFEDGGKSIAIEFASADFEFHPLLNLRGGIVMNPIGAFNQNHDGPKWEFTDRPIASTQMLPATWSNAGFGLFGKLYRKNYMFGYEAYITGGFDNSIIDNHQNRTYLPATKDNADRFEESASGTPLLTVKIAQRVKNIGELGLSYMGGIYNTFQKDGLILDDKRRCDVWAVDYNTTLPKLNTFITGEWAWILVNIPETYTQQYGKKQHGGFLDIVQPIMKKRMLGWDKAVLNIACRLEYVDWNVGTFNETGTKIGDNLWSIMPAVSFRPTSQTVFRFNYRYQIQEDIFSNPPQKTGGYSFGISTYF